MRNPAPPFLEFGFYFDRLSGREAFRKLVRTMTEDIGATPKEITCLNSEESILFRTNEPLTRSPASQTDLWNIIDDGNRFAIKLAIENGTKIVPGAREYLAILPIFSSDPGNCGNPVGIWIEGEVFSHPSSLKKEIAPSQRRVGLKARSAFVNLIQLLNPTYAAITICDGLIAPCDLRKGHRSSAFRDFYLQSEHFGENMLQEIPRRFPKAHFENLGTGQFVTTSKAFARNKSGSELSFEECSELCVYVGKLIARS